MDQARLMDRIYGLQRHFYDMTRRFCLVGRDRLLNRAAVRAGETVLEVGCGTARNLIVLARQCPGARLFGLDISEQMLATARAKIRRRELSGIELIRGSAEAWDHQETFGLTERFDMIFFSYSLSMIPDWRAALETAARNLKPGGRLLVVDFWDQRDWPGWARRILTRWLAIFHVRYDPGMIEYLQLRAARGEWTLELESIGRRYAFWAEGRSRG